MAKKNEVMAVTLDSCWSTEAEAKALKERFAKDYDVKAEFHDGGDHYSSWRLEGHKDDLKRSLMPNGTPAIRTISASTMPWSSWPRTNSKHCMVSRPPIIVKL